MIQKGFYEEGKIYSTKKKGLFVRSKGEREIANFLYDQELKFEYEPDMVIGEIKLHPDFYLSEWNIIIEYFGILESRVYREKCKWKIELYEQYKMKVIVLEPQLWGSFGAYIRAGFMTHTKRPFPQVKEFNWRKEEEAMGS
jgi:hypothetical protein